MSSVKEFDFFYSTEHNIPHFLSQLSTGATKDMGKMLGGEEEKDPDAQKKEEERQEALRQQEEERKAKYAKMEAERENLRQGIRDKVKTIYIYCIYMCVCAEFSEIVFFFSFFLLLTKKFWLHFKHIREVTQT